MHFPKSRAATQLARKVVEAFAEIAEDIDSRIHQHGSNEVLVRVAPALRQCGFAVEASKKRIDKVSVPVLFGLNGRTEKTFDADAYNESEGFVVEVEAGRGVVNNQFLKDLFQACMMHEVHYLALALRNQYRANQDFEIVCRFFETLYASQRLQLPLRGILIIGY
jgi:hypothetical protein